MHSAEATAAGAQTFYSVPFITGIHEPLLFLSLLKAR